MIALTWTFKFKGADKCYINSKKHYCYDKDLCLFQFSWSSFASDVKE